MPFPKAMPNWYPVRYLVLTILVIVVGLKEYFDYRVHWSIDFTLYVGIPMTLLWMLHKAATGDSQTVDE